MIEEQKYRQLIIYVIIYFFLNSFLLPHGLLYTTLLSPVMIYFLIKESKLRLFFFWSLIILIPIPFQITTGIELSSFIVSNIIILTCLLFIISSYYLLKNTVIINNLFRSVLIINSGLVVAAIVILPFEEVRGLLWYDIPITKGLELIPRLKMFTYEASYYSLVMMPVFLYFILRVFYNNEKHPLLIFLASAVPLLLSLSFGVIGALLIALILCVVLYWRKIPVDLKRFTILSSISVIVLLGFLYVVWPENPIYFRLTNIFSGKDTSAMGRLVYSFMFAKDIIIQNNAFFGIGAGQVKIIAHDMIVNHYKYYGTLETVVRIPNSMAEILAIYGFYGFLIKLFLEIWFFFKCRIYTNLYSIVLFLFIFIYQFTGSFITNVAEIGIWVIVFSVKFSDFEFVPHMSKKYF
jgi:O-antigen ligase/polysaccharide polymerase Wzy-like membrane protein